MKTNLNLVKGEQTKAMMTYSFNEQKNANLMETIELTQDRELYILYQILQLFNFFLTRSKTNPKYVFAGYTGSPKIGRHLCRSELYIVQEGIERLCNLYWITLLTNIYYKE